MSEKDKKITSLSAFRARKTKPTAHNTPGFECGPDEIREGEEPHPLSAQDSPEMVPGFNAMTKKAQQQVVQAFKNAQGFMCYINDRQEQVMDIAKKLRQFLDSEEDESGVLVAALILNACAGLQYIGIASPEASIIVTSIYNQLLVNVRENKESPPEPPEDKPN